MKRAAIMMLAGALLAACSKTVDTACTAFKPIRYSASRDSAETVQDAREHNAAWVALCR